MNQQRTFSYQLGLLSRPIASILLVSAIFIVMLIAILLGGNWGGPAVASKIQGLLAMDSVQIWWYVTRASGLTGYFLIWLSMIWGFAIPIKILQPALEGTFTYDFHEHLSLMGLGFIVLHVGVLLFDKYLPFNIFQILIPFIDSYRPLWVGLGIISFYILLLVTFTFYLRQQIGVKAFRSIHVLSLLGYLGTTLHGLFAGTDSALPVTMFLYVGTFLIVVFLTIYWLFMRFSGRNDKPTVEQLVKKTVQHSRR
jgi:sulfoxide reductase heme-binding subunit YedZ